ncbi:UNVERIFIED_ORG: type I restriction enzyme S subunit [Sphingomonas sp. R1F5B]
MSELPQGWAETTVGEVTEPFVSIDPTKQPDTEFRYVDIGAIDKSTQTIGEPKSFLGRDAPSRARRVIHEGDVLFSTVRTYLKNIAAVPEELDGSLTSTGIAVLRASGAIDHRYLFNWVCSDEFVGKMSGAQDGTLYPAVTDKDVSGAAVPLPPLPEQRRIVAKVDGLTARTARARKELDRIPTLIARYKQRLLALAFSGESTASWRASHGLGEPIPTTVNDLSEGLRYGTAQKSYAEPNGVGVLRIPNVASGRISLDDLKYSKLEPKEFAKLRLSEGDILVVRSNGSVDLVGRPALVTGDAVGLAYAGYLIRIRPKRDVVMPKFLTLMLEAPAIRSTIEAGARSTSGVNNVNATELGALTVPLFDIDEQAEIVRRIESAFGWLDRMASDHAAAARLLPKLDAAILAKAFRGELVPQDPNDEPASALLERIKVERGADGAKSGRRGRSVRHVDLEAKTKISTDVTATLQVSRAKMKGAAMAKSREDDDVKGQPYLAGLLKSGRISDAQSLFRTADLPVADFYKQLAWEIDKGHVIDSSDELKAV